MFCYTCMHNLLFTVTLSDFLIRICQIPSGIQGGRMVHNQATMLELRSLLSEMKELLHQQVTWAVSQPVPVNLLMESENTQKQASKLNMWFLSSIKDLPNIRVDILITDETILTTLITAFSNQMYGWFGVWRLNDIMRWKIYSDVH